MPSQNKGLLLGFIGVAIFSLTLPMTAQALAGGLSPAFVSFGRAVVAASIAAVVLLVARVPLPARALRRDLTLATLGIVVGWPLMSTLALKFVPPSHAAIFNGLLPFSTALIGALLTREWPRKAFWLCAIAGAVMVTSYGWWRGDGGLHVGDSLLLIAAALGGLGYAAGARVSRALPGWQVISWALVFGLPLTLPVALAQVPDVADVSAKAWWAFLYLALMSQYVGFFFWYRGLALGGISRVSQVQLLQIFMTLFASSLIVGESIDAVTWMVAAATIGIIALSKRL